MIAMVAAATGGRSIPSARAAEAGRLARPVSAAVAVVVPVLAAVAITLHVDNGSTDLTTWWLGGLSLALTMVVPGVLIARSQPRNPVGWLLLAACVAEVVTSAGREYLVHGLLGGTAPGWLWAGWFTDSCYIVAIASLPALLMLFPDGRAFGRRTRYLVLLPAAALPLGWFGYLFTGDVATVRGHTLANPVAHLVPRGLADASAAVGQVLVLLSMVVAGVLLIIRLRRAEGTRRLQLKWVVWAGTIQLVEVATEFLPNNPAAVYTSVVAQALLAAAIAVAILRHRLFDIDVVINRTLVFASLTVVVAGLYVAVVVVIAAVVGGSPHLGPGLAATALVAVAFAPVRVRLQRGVDRLMYGERRNPYRVMTQLGRRLERDDAADDELTVVVDTVTQALKLPYAAIVGPDGASLAESGTPSAPALSQPLSYQGAQMGHLLVQPRDRGGRFDRAEQRLLQDLARQVGAAVHAVRLSADLQASRTRLVSAKEEERRRLRRDLHDGLGPKLAALGLKLDAAHALADTRPDSSKELLGKVRDDIRTTIEDVRRLVYGLRPPALDELGLLGALRECANRFETGAPAIVVDAPFELPPLPAAVEVAAYWIVNEALTNVVRHADAARCSVEVCLDDALRIAVRDDGRGLAGGWRPGVGTSSMRERAAELGGTVTVSAGADGRGTEVQAVIPR